MTPRMAHWTLDDIPWQQFDPGKVKPELVSLVKAAAMVECNGRDYARYLCEVFASEDDAEFRQAADYWADEEVQHGQALRRWAELADPSFDFDQCFKMFSEGYKLPFNVSASVRGSRSGELIARCIVEVGTSSYYTAIGDYTDEPVLRAVCAKIAADELRHYKLFYTHLKEYLKRENIGFARRLAVALGRIAESEDDELAYAYFAAHGDTGRPYNRKEFSNHYMARACMLYRREHIERMTAMVFKAVGLKPNTWLNRLATRLAWGAMRWKNLWLTKYRVQALAG